MNEDQMKQRTKEFAKQIIKLCRQLPNNREGRLIGDQLFRSGTSVAANYRSACRARSMADFISKLSIVEEEARKRGDSVTRRMFEDIVSQEEEHYWTFDDYIR